MRLFGKRRKHRTSKSAEVKAREQKAKVETFLDKTYLKYLRDHPTFAETVARERFGMEPGYEGNIEESPPVGFEDKVKEVKSAVDLVRTEFYHEDKPSGLMGLFHDIIQQDKDGDLAKAMADGISTIVQAVKQRQPQLPAGEQPQLPTGEQPQPKKPSAEEQQKAMISDIEQLIVMEPKQVAEIIYQHRDKPQHPLGLVYQYMVQNDFDTLFSMIPQITSAPNYEFLQPVLDKIDEEWLALVYDELHLLLEPTKSEKKPNKTNE